MPGPSLAGFVLYFLRLGSSGFGGPVALANAMRRDLVEKRGWISEREYDDGLAIAAACPGPLAYQLAVYCGYVRFGALGGVAVAAAFAAPPFVLVVAVAWAYVGLAATWQLRALFYGIGPVVVALILKACWNLGRRTLRGDRIAWIFFVVACAVTVVVQKELAPLFVVAGLLGAFLFARSAAATPQSPAGPGPAASGRPAAGSLLPSAIVGAGGAMSAKIFLFFFKTGLLVFGSGLVIVSFLKSYVVDQYHWLDNRQFLDSVAIGMISPGPVVIAATFVGFLLDGVGGAGAATVGIFAPSVLFTVLATPLLLRYRDNPRLRGFIRGVTVAVVGVLVGTTWLVGRSAIGDWPTAALGIVTLVILFAAKRIPEPLIVLAGGLVGLVAFRIVDPQWVLR